MPPRIHPTAIIDPSAELAGDVVVGPHVIIEGAARVGTGCVLHAHAQLVGPLELGPRNTVGRGAVLGDEPQHLAASGAGAELLIGPGNTFRENVTVHRGSGPGKATRIGAENYFMIGSHVGHDCMVGDRCILANNALLGGHVVIHDGAYVSGNSAVHQRIHVGRLAMISGTSAVTRDLPPFVIAQSFNLVFGVNVVGMRRAGYAAEQIDAVRRAFRMLFMQRDLISVALDKIEGQLGAVPAVAEFVGFIRSSPNGICSIGHRLERRAAA
jgi:UDP-N-acetylglucosamine acyltransferase